MDTPNNIIDSFSKHLFWDVDKKEMDINKHARYIINSVLQYGFYKDWEILLQQYKLKKIVAVSIRNKWLDKKTASFIALISNTPIKEFQCYITKQSNPQHWNF